MAGLPLAGEEQHRLAVLVLKTVNRLVRDLRDVQFPLSGRVRVELLTDLVGAGLDLVRRCIAPHQVRHVQEVNLFEHALLRERHLVDGVVGHPVPIDEVVDHVPVGAERQHAGNDLHGEAVVGGQALELRNFIEMLGRQRLVALGRKDRRLLGEGFFLPLKGHHRRAACGLVAGFRRDFAHGSPPNLRLVFGPPISSSSILHPTQFERQLFTISAARSALQEGAPINFLGRGIFLLYCLVGRAVTIGSLSEP